MSSLSDLQNTNDQKRPLFSLEEFIEKTFKIDLEDTKFLIKRKFRVFIDFITVYKLERWVAFCMVLALLVIRLLIIKTHAVIAYMLGIYYLKNLMLYL